MAEAWTPSPERMTHMKLFDVDWTDFIRRLADWDQLSLRASKATAITETVIELAESKRDAAFFRKLDAMAICTEQSKPPTQESRRKRPRRRCWWVHPGPWQLAQSAPLTRIA